MTGMTPERLDTIRANLPTPDADLSRRERDALDLLAEVDRLRHENADLRRSRDERKATERRRRTEDREAWMRAHGGEAKRLRAGIEALHRPEPFHDDPTATFCAHCQRTAGVWPCPTAALLNPTEGEPK